MRFLNTTKKKKLALSEVEGFTIVELLVAMSIFIIVITVAVAVFVNALKGQRYLVKQMQVVNNMGLVLEQMAREMRTGYQFNGGNGPFYPQCLSSIQFSDWQSNPTGPDVKTTYAFANGAIGRTGPVADGSVVSASLTPSDVDVENGCFYIVQDANTLTKPACNPPRILIRMSVASTGSDQNTPPAFIETTVSSRIIPAEIKDDPGQCRTQ